MTAGEKKPTRWSEGLDGTWGGGKVDEGVETSEEGRAKMLRTVWKRGEEIGRGEAARRGEQVYKLPLLATAQHNHTVFALEPAEALRIVTTALALLRPYSFKSRSSSPVPRRLCTPHFAQTRLRDQGSTSNGPLGWSWKQTSHPQRPTGQREEGAFSTTPSTKPLMTSLGKNGTRFQLLIRLLLWGTFDNLEVDDARISTRAAGGGESGRLIGCSADYVRRCALEGVGALLGWVLRGG
ncbi:hypothetical protein BJ912DRAFT_1040319 [Pholiota molesta]|nr:hypothetical protein BJ912DRAFT_1040319 [Pholiota molesta]